MLRQMLQSQQQIFPYNLQNKKFMSEPVDVENIISGLDFDAKDYAWTVARRVQIIRSQQVLMQSTYWQMAQQLLN